MRNRSKRTTGLLVLALCVSLAPIPGSTHPVERAIVRVGSANAVAGHVIVRFDAAATKQQRARSLKTAHATTIRNLLLKDWALVKVPGNLKVAIKLLQRTGVIKSAEPDYLHYVQALIPNDPCMNIGKDGRCPSNAWHLDAISAFQGWERYPGTFYSPAHPKSLIPPASRIKVAVIDAPVLRESADFKNGFTSEDMNLGGQIDLAGMNGFTTGVQQEGGSFKYHGTYVAGLVGASANNSYATAGVDYQADILPIPAVHGDTGAADATVVGDGIIYAHQRGARVINLSLGLTQPSAYVNAAIQQVVSEPNPPLVVAAAGNNTQDQPFYPAWFDNVMAVGGTDQFDRKARCANWSSHVSVAAPAKDVQSLGYETTMAAPECGTSAATPQVSALAALLFAQDPSRTPEVVRSIIETTADDLGPAGRDDEFGFGRINVDRALAYGVPIADVRMVRSTPARAGGGSTTITAHANSNAPITNAELFVERRPGDTDAGFPMRAADGAFGGYQEDLVATYSSSSLSPGPHRISVRAGDMTGQWSPLATGIIYVDGFAPALSNLTAADTIRILDEGSLITFDSADEYSESITYDVDVTWTLDQTVHAWHSGFIHAAGGSQSVLWRPKATDLPGRYTVKVTVRDEAGNAAAAATSMLLI